MTQKEFSTSKKAAENQLKSAKDNIFFWQKNLRGLAKKNEFCDGKPVAQVAKAVRNYTHGGSMFDVSAFTKDSQGRYCTLSRSKKCPVWGKDVVNVSEEGWEYLQPVTLTLNGVFNAFCKVASAEIKAIEKAEKEAICAEEKAEKEAKKAAEKEAKKAERIKVQKMNELQRALDKGIITTEEYTAKVAAL